MYPFTSEDDSTANLLKRMKVQEVIIALPDLTVERKQRLYERYRRTGCSVKIYDYPSGTEEKSTAKRTPARFSHRGPAVPGSHRGGES